LAKESRVYENAYTACPLCSPARASILTGLFPHGHGITCNTENIGCNVSELNDSPTLLPRILSANGYSCGFNGKWHLGTSGGNSFGSGRKAALPSDFGYEGMDFPGHGGIGMNYPQYKKYLEDNSYSVNVEIKEEMLPLLYGSWKEGEEVGVPHFITDHTISLMEDFRKRDKPFFMHHNFWGPHQPYYVPEKYLRMYDDVEIPQWKNFECDENSLGPYCKLRKLANKNRTNWKAWQELIKHKYAFMTYIDHQVGRMLDYLDSSGLADNTIVIFTADHGDNLGTHGGLLDKGFVHFEDTHRIPLIMREPDKKGSRPEDLASLLDVYPTILEKAGIEAPEHIHGRSMLSKEAPRDYVVTEFHGLGGATLSMRTIRSGNLKYGWTCCYEELYDLETDPYEMKNLAENPDYAESLKEMKLKLLNWMNKSSDQLNRYYERMI
jgi:arylsulfatase A-like enzyme